MNEIDTFGKGWEDMKKKLIIASRWCIFTGVLGCLLVLQACTGQLPAISSTGGLRAWLDQPVDGDTIPLAAFSLKAHARNEASGGVNRIDFLVNGVLIGSVNTDASQPLVTAELPWNPSVTGMYYIQAQAVGSGGSAPSEIARVCVAAPGDTGPCTLPGQEGQASPGDITLTPATQEPEDDLDFKLGASPDPVYIGDCLKGEPKVVNFEGYVADPSGAIEVDLQGFLRSASGAQQEFMLTMSPTSGGGYTASYDLSALDASALSGANGTLVYTIALLNDHKEFYATSSEKTLQVFLCGVEQPGITPGGTTVVPLQTGDTTVPSVKASISADVIYYGGQGCSPASVTVTAYVTDNVGVAQANIYWYYAPEGDPYHSQSAFMSGSGSNWSYTITPSQTGTIAYWVEAWDTSNNHAQSTGPNTVAVVACQQNQPPPVATTPPPVQPPQDSTPPKITAWPSFDMVYFDSYGKGCDASFPTYVDIYAKVTDDSGVAQANLYWYWASSGNPDNASVIYMDRGDSGWVARIYPDHGNDTLVWWVKAWDNVNNHASSGGSNTVTVGECKAP